MMTIDDVAGQRWYVLLVISYTNHFFLLSFHLFYYYKLSTTETGKTTNDGHQTNDECLHGPLPYRISCNFTDLIYFVYYIIMFKPYDTYLLHVNIENSKKKEKKTNDGQLINDSECRESYVS